MHCLLSRQICSVKCQKEHRKKHKKECRRRAAELRDELLFKQPQSTHLGDCPICCIPLPIDLEGKSNNSMMPCCSKTICDGCNYAHQKRQIDERVEKTCPFCRNPNPNSKAEADRILMKRVEANDPVALREAGNQRNEKGDFIGAVEYWRKAAKFGDVVAHHQLSCFYYWGKGVEKDEEKELYHLEQAAIGGDPDARYHLGTIEGENRRLERARRHFIIAANLGHGESMEKLKEMYQFGMVSKEDFAAALRAHQAAVDAMKSPHREVVPKSDFTF